MKWEGWGGAYSTYHTMPPSFSPITIYPRRVVSDIHRTVAIIYTVSYPTAADTTTYLIYHFDIRNEYTILQQHPAHLITTLHHSSYYAGITHHITLPYYSTPKLNETKPKRNKTNQTTAPSALNNLPARARRPLPMRPLFFFRLSYVSPHTHTHHLYHIIHVYTTFSFPYYALLALNTAYASVYYAYIIHAVTTVRLAVGSMG